MNVIFPLVLATLILRSEVESQQVLGCNGYVRSDFAIDFSRINVGLFTEHGGQRDTTDCAPTSGYFFVPVEQPAKYILKVLPPPGWHVNPSEKEVDIDGHSDPCSKNEDIVFTFQGFSVSGQVASKDKETGPTGITVDLVDKQDTKVASATSDSKGNFELKGIKPGDYRVQISEKSLESFSFEVREREVKVMNDKIIVEPFVIIGYDVEGSILDRSNKPVRDVEIELKHEDVKLKSQISDKFGKFRFSNISRGSYQLVTVSSDAGLSITPDSRNVEVLDKNVFIDNFVLEHFVVKGSVLNEKKGQPIQGVKVTGQQGDYRQSATTDSKGNYQLKVKHQGNLILTFSKDTVQIDDLTIESIVPGFQIEETFPQRFVVRGDVEVGYSDKPVIIEFKNKKTNKVQVKDIRASHPTFEVFLTPGDYLVKVESSDEETYFPQEMLVSVGPNKESKNLQFKVAKFSLSGGVECLHKNCEDILVVLSTQGSHVVTQFQEVVDSKFEFYGIRQGNYVVAIDKGDKRCWADPERKVKVTKDTSGIVFKQSGSLINVRSNKDTKLMLTDTSGKQMIFDISQGENKVCVQGAGKVSIATEGCYGFKIEPESLNLEQDTTLTLTAVRFRVSGQIESKSTIPDLEVTAASEERGEQQLDLKKTQNGYTFELDASNTENLILKPLSKFSFFDPTLSVVQVRDVCEQNVIVFKARDGIFVEGSLTPPVEGAEIVVTDKEDKEVHALSEKDGSFKIGPFEDNEEKRIEVSKEGYHFEATEVYGNFKSKRLSSITVTLTDESGKPLPDDAVIAISSNTNYRSNEKTKSGMLKFGSLHPGEYFIKAFLKEWVFEPKNIIINLKENSNEKRVLVAQRVAFSVYGKLTYLNSSPASNVVILAKGKSDSCLGKVEDATTSNDGSFRLRGLEPGCSYEVTTGSKEISSFITKFGPLEVQDSDIHFSQPIIVHTKPEIFHVCVKIKTVSGIYLSGNNKRKTIPLVATSDNGMAPERRFNIVPNELTTLPSFNVIDDEYIFKVDGKVIKRIGRNNAEFHFIPYDLVEEKRNTKQKEAGSKAAFLVAVALIGITAYMFRHSYMQKKNV